jgi:hypothetical protein
LIQTLTSSTLTFSLQDKYVSAKSPDKMFAARANQENAIYEQQAAAAAKPLNQGVKGLVPKTPASKVPKTPFKANDENAMTVGRKTEVANGTGAKQDKSVFVTPAGMIHFLPLV